MFQLNELVSAFLRGGPRASWGGYRTKSLCSRGVSRCLRLLRGYCRLVEVWCLHCFLNCSVMKVRPGDVWG